MTPCGCRPRPSQEEGKDGRDGVARSPECQTGRTAKRFSLMRFPWGLGEDRYGQLGVTTLGGQVERLM